MAGSARIDFTVPLRDTPTVLRFKAIDQPAERLAIHTDRDGELGEPIAKIIPPGDVDWTEEELSAWVSESFLPLLAEAKI